LCEDSCGANCSTTGFGGFLIVHLADPDAVLTEAYLDATGQVVGDPLMMWGRFVLKKDIPKDQALAVWGDEPLSTSAEAQTLPTTIVNGLFVTQDYN